MDVPLNEFTKRIFEMHPEWRPVGVSWEGVLATEKDKP